MSARQPPGAGPARGDRLVDAARRGRGAAGSRPPAAGRASPLDRVDDRRPPLLSGAVAGSSVLVFFSAPPLEWAHDDDGAVRVERRRRRGLGRGAGGVLWPGHVLSGRRWRSDGSSLRLPLRLPVAGLILFFLFYLIDLRTRRRRSSWRERCAWVSRTRSWRASCGSAKPKRAPRASAPRKPTAPSRASSPPRATTCASRCIR